MPIAFVNWDDHDIKAAVVLKHLMARNEMTFFGPQVFAYYQRRVAVERLATCSTRRANSKRPQTKRRFAKYDRQHVFTYQ